MNRNIVLAILLALLTIQAAAQGEGPADGKADPGLSARELKDVCDPAAASGQAAKLADDKICLAYLRGVADGLFLSGVLQQSGAPVCLPQDGPVSPDEARDEFNGYMKDHPEAAGHSAGVAATFAIVKAHSCE